MRPGFLDFVKSVLFGFGIVSVSHVIFTIFSQTIPSTVIGFFRDVSAAFILMVVFAFAFTWFLKARPHNRPKRYAVIVFDVFGNQTEITGLRTDFKNHDVAWSFMKQYKNDYPLHNFAMVSDAPNSEKKTIFRYI
ncbi:MAG: hypothetical protein HW420_1274 [Candidatus Nitrosotenuis sp.]|nr:hypothetical protein [Candidatus Nitrosotenuis sp.]